jgi:YVTN family beta-propeller protein
MKYVKLTLIIFFFVFLLTNCGINTPPATPDSPVGPIVGIPGISSVFKASTTDRNNDNISYQFDWGDGEASAWSDFIPSGDTVSFSRLYLQRGMYAVRVHAQDARDKMSRWSNPLYLMVGFPDTLVRGVGIGNNPSDIEVLPNGQRIYATNNNDGNVSVISGSDHSVLGSIPVGNGPIGIAALPNSQYVYVMVNGGNYVLSIPTSSGPMDTILIPDPVFAAALSSGEYVYVTSPSTGNVYVIRTFDNAVVDTIGVGGAPLTIAAVPNGQNIYVSISPYKSYKIRTTDNTVVDSIPGGATDMTFSLNGEYLYGCSPGLIFVVRTSDNSPVTALEVGFDPVSLCVHPSGLLLYAADNSSNTVSIIYMPNNTIIKEDISVYDGPTYMAASPNGEYIYVLCSRANTVGVIGYRQSIVVSSGQFRNKREKLNAFVAQKN